MNRILLLILAWLSVIVGIVGVAVPLLPGIPLLLIGLVLLARHYPWAGSLLRRIRSNLRIIRKRCAKCRFA